MKRNWMIIAVLLWIAQTTNAALIVSTDEYGELPAEGLEITINEAQTDLMTGKALMEIQGSMLCSAPVTVTITRSQNGIEDQFCCADDCTNGNEQLSEKLHFTPQGMASWFVHYYPQASSNVTVTYTFSDGTDTRTLVVHYVYNTQGVNEVETRQERATKVIRDGLLYIIKNNQTYHL